MWPSLKRMPGNGREMTPHTAYIGVGSNMGDKLANCREGVRTLTASTPDTRLSEISPYYKTEPMDFKEQDWFVNAVVKIETSLDPFGLLEMLKTIQKKAGRVKDIIRFGPRILDLDILFYDDRIIETAQLTIPHPRLHQRRFVLQPLCDISPGMVHPVMKKPIRTLLAMLDGREGRVAPIS